MSGLALTEYDICLSRQEHGAGPVREQACRKAGMPPDPVPEKIRTTGKGHQGSHGSPPTRNTLIRPPDMPRIPGHPAYDSVTDKKDTGRKAIWMPSLLSLQQRPHDRRIFCLGPVRLAAFLQTVAAHSVAGNSQGCRCVFSRCTGVHAGHLL